MYFRNEKAALTLFYSLRYSPQIYSTRDKDGFFFVMTVLEESGPSKMSGITQRLHLEFNTTLCILVFGLGS